MEANNFRDRQADYAAHGVATFPVDANKRPMVSRYGGFGLVASSKIAGKFANAPAIGFMCGKRNGITSLDCDPRTSVCLPTPLTVTDKHHWSPEQAPVISRPGIGITVSTARSGQIATCRSIFSAAALWLRRHRRAPRAPTNLYPAAHSLQHNQTTISLRQESD